MEKAFTIGEQCAGDERCANYEYTGECYVSIRVSHAAENGVVLEQALEASEVCERGDN